MTRIYVHAGLESDSYLNITNKLLQPGKIFIDVAGIVINFHQLTFQLQTVLNWTKDTRIWSILTKDVC